MDLWSYFLTARQIHTIRMDKNEHLNLFLNLDKDHFSSIENDERKRNEKIKWEAKSNTLSERILVFKGITSTTGSFRKNDLF